MQVLDEGQGNIVLSDFQTEVVVVPTEIVNEIGRILGSEALACYVSLKASGDGPASYYEVGKRVGKTELWAKRQVNVLREAGFVVS